VVRIDPSKPITEKLDVLLAVQPSAMGETEMSHFIEAIKSGVPTAQSVNCVTKDPGSGVELAALQMPSPGAKGVTPYIGHDSFKFEKFTSQDELGIFLVKHYKIRTPNELASCEVCHR